MSSMYFATCGTSRSRRDPGWDPRTATTNRLVTDRHVVSVRAAELTPRAHTDSLLRRNSVAAPRVRWQASLVQDLELAPLLDMDWPALNHHLARAHLDRLGWPACGEGDWAYALRSPSGRLAARVSPFELAYGYFVQLCQSSADNQYLPRIELATQLEGGGHLTVLEYLHSAEQGAVNKFLR